MTSFGLGSTYRLQLHGLGLSAAADVVPYLSDLGIETVYLSPVFAAAPGSTHGYDVIDPGRIDPALGSPEDLETLLEACRSHSMRVLLDIVPNHMSTDTANPRWWEVLARGRESASADVFDIDWDRHAGRVLLPVLGRPLAEVLADNGAAVVDQSAVELDGVRLPLAEGTSTGTPGEVLARQHYRPAFWRSAATMGNYRRFFDINGLVGVRVEDPRVFDETHELVTRMSADDRIAGVRVDHVDGLADPRTYLARLRAAVEQNGPKAVLVEKILGRHEHLPADWPIDGTTGYEFADLAGGMLLDQEGTGRLAALGAALTGEPSSFATAATAAKDEILARSFDADLDRLARLALDAMDASHPGHDLSRRDVRQALAGLTVHLDVYRTYLDEGAAGPADRAAIERAAGVAGETFGADGEVRRALAIVVDALAGRSGLESLWLEVARRWQQLSGAVMAKGAEDTATYRYPGLLAHAEVGCDPERAPVDVDSFHRFVRERPRGLNATSTHDSKRNEDARCRLAVLSEAGAPWERLVRRWHRRFGGEAAARAPHAGEELAAYQAILALWPVTADRLDRATRRRAQDYLVKAAREAKRRTSWDHPDDAYERRLTAFVARVAGDAAFRAEMTQFARRIAPAALTNALTLLACKCCAPGTPDFYQGTELFAPALTDPDNRRPVDFGQRRAMLDSLPAPSAVAATSMRQGWTDGRLKLFTTHALLQTRRRNGALFEEGDYRPLRSSSDHLVSFARRLGPQVLICLAARLTWTLAGPGRFAVGPVWEGQRVELPRWASGTYTDVFTGRTMEATGGGVSLDEAFRYLPVAVLLSAAG